MNTDNPLSKLRRVHVVGIGLHAYQRPSDTPYVSLGLAAIRMALDDAAITWPEIGSTTVGTALLGMAPGRELIRYLGATGRPVHQVENASASGSSAFRTAVQQVASGFTDVALAVGVDKVGPVAHGYAKSGVPTGINEVIAPATHFALLMQAHMTETGTTSEQIAAVAVKNHQNGSLNPFAQRRQARTLEEVLAGPRIAGELTRLQCTLVGEGAAAVIVASDEAIERLGIDASRSVQVVSSAAQSEALYGSENADVALTRSTVTEALEQAGIEPTDLDIVELHDAFAIEELLYTEAIGLCKPGDAGRAVAAGEFSIGGRVAVSPSGGLLAMGHPIGPTGVGQIAEITRQLRGEAGDRQHHGARTGLAHMVGIGAVCVAHVLQR